MLLGMVVLTASSCASRRQSGEGGGVRIGNFQPNSDDGSSGPTADIEVQGCLIRGRIVAVDTTSGRSTNRMDPCAYAPCLATVLILTWDCTSGLAADLKTGDTLTVRFTRSLAASADLPMAVSWRLPGLREGDEFEARMEVRMLPYGEREFVVGEYAKGE